MASRRGPLQVYIDGILIPTPIRGLTESISTNVNAGRNANGEMIGERVGRDMYKLDNLEWRGLFPEEWEMICQLMKPFKFHVRFPDMVNGGYCTHLCYCGDRHAEPYFLDDTGYFERYRVCKANIIDCAIVGD